MTPYALEAFVRYTKLSRSDKWDTYIRSIFDFFDKDVPVLDETDQYMVTAYSNLKDRKVVNAVSYVMYSYSLLLEFVDPSRNAVLSDRIRKLYNYIVMNQATDGSWMYSASGNSFIDCFHSCIVLKNLQKTSKNVFLRDVSQVVRRGYNFIKNSMFDRSEGLAQRFAKANKPGMVKFDLYDNAELLNVAVLLGDDDFARQLHNSIESRFVRKNNFYSHIDFLGMRYGRNYLRWAILPYLYAKTSFDLNQSRRTEKCA